MDEASRAKRTAALEEKKRRLEELKKRRQQNAAASSHRTPIHSVSSTPIKNGSTTTTAASETVDLDHYIDNLLSRPAPNVVPGSPTNNGNEQSEGTTNTTTNTAAATTTSVVKVESSTSTSTSSAAAVVSTPVTKVISVVQKKVETFSASTQTEETEFPPCELVEEKDENVENEQQQEEEKKDDEDSNDTGAVPKLHLLSPEEKEQTVNSDPFASFFLNASKKVERLLGAPTLVDLLIDADYAGDKNDNNPDNNNNNNKNDSSFGMVAGRACFQCVKWTHNRDVTDMDWSNTHKELIVTSYHMPGYSTISSSAVPTHNTPSNTMSQTQRTSSTSTGAMSNATVVPRPGENQADGLALIWSLAMTDRPEHIFTCGSPLLCTKFHPTEPHLLLGGTHSGQLIVWDLRVGRLPVQRSSLSTVANKLKGHSHPICGLDLADGGSGLVTASTDGKVNFWSLANLRDPAESLPLNSNISSLAVTPETNTILVGDETGCIHAIYPQNSSSSNRSNSSSRRAVKKINSGYNDHNGHFGMITSVSTKAMPKLSSLNQQRGSVSKGFLTGAQGLVLTCGVDWTTKLWAPAYKDTPLSSFLSPSYDYMSDVQWSPTHPTLFATASSKGTMGLWNLATDLDEPMTGSEGIPVEDHGAGNNKHLSGLNKLRWSADGRRIAVAASDKLYVLGMTEEVCKPKAEDEGKMMNNLTSRGFLDEE